MEVEYLAIQLMSLLKCQIMQNSSAAARNCLFPASQKAKKPVIKAKSRLYLSKQNLLKKVVKQAKHRWAAGESLSSPTAGLTPARVPFYCLVVLGWVASWFLLWLRNQLLRGRHGLSGGHGDEGHSLPMHCELIILSLFGHFSYCNCYLAAGSYHNCLLNRMWRLR